MKRLFVIILVVIFCFSVFFGCNNAENVGGTDDSKNSPTPTTTTTIFPQSPPDLLVSYGKTTIEAWRGSSQWCFQNEDGEEEVLHMDSVHPTNVADRIEVITVSNNATLSLNFEVAPTRIRIEQYKAKGFEYEYCGEIAVENSTIKVKKGDYLYDIAATWEDETKDYNNIACYAFRTK